MNSKLADVPAQWNAVTEKIIAAAIEVHRGLGPGYSERNYEDAMQYELCEGGLCFERQLSFRVPYKTILLSEQRVDLLVEGLVIVELKAIERVPEVDLAKLVSYLRSFEVPLGLLINFHVLRVTDGVYRRINLKAVPATLARLKSRPLSPSALSAPPRSGL